MPELRRRPRRGMERMVVETVREDRPVEVVQKKSRGLPLLLGTLGAACLAYLTHPLWWGATPPAPGGPLRVQGYTTKKGRVAVPTRTRRTGVREFEGSSALGRRGYAQRAAAKLKEVVVQVQDVLPRILAAPTRPESFKDRLAAFERIFASLPDPERRALLPNVDPANIRRLFTENPEEACLLVDKLVGRLNILVINQSLGG